MRIINIIFFSLFFYSCSNNNTANLSDKETVSLDSLPHNSLEIKESKNEEDTLPDDGRPERLKLIRENFKKLNSISNWTKVEEKFYDASIEGGTAKFYYQNKQLQKIITVSYGESYRNLIEYYLLNGQLSFVFEKTYKYNRPFNYDSTAMKENNDTEVFDLSKATLIEVRNYFENSKLIHQISSLKEEESKDKNLSSEQKRILEEYAKLLTLSKEP